MRRAKKWVIGLPGNSKTYTAKNLAKFGTLRLEHPSRKERARMTARELVNRISLLDMVKQLGDRLTVGQRTLTPPVLVRIQVPQPVVFTHDFTPSTATKAGRFAARFAFSSFRNRLSPSSGSRWK